MSTSAGVTRLLHDVKLGDHAAQEELFPLVYDELRCLAHRRLRSRRDDILDTSGLVHEAYLRLFGHHTIDWQDRSHFFALASRAMRQILIDHFRRTSAQKRGASAVVLPLHEIAVPADMRGDVLLALDEALTRLSGLNPRLSRVVEYKFFGGMTQEEIAETMCVSVRTVRNDWRKAKAWLASELSEA